MVPNQIRTQLKKESCGPISLINTNVKMLKKFADQIQKHINNIKT
jgi:hypothetical protein